MGVARPKQGIGEQQEASSLSLFLFGCSLFHALFAFFEFCFTFSYSLCSSLSCPPRTYIVLTSEGGIFVSCSRVLDDLLNLTFDSDQYLYGSSNGSTSPSRGADIRVTKRPPVKLYTTSPTGCRFPHLSDHDLFYPTPSLQPPHFEASLFGSTANASFLIHLLSWLPHLHLSLLVSACSSKRTTNFWLPCAGVQGPGSAEGGRLGRESRNDSSRFIWGHQTDKTRRIGSGGSPSDYGAAHGGGTRRVHGPHSGKQRGPRRERRINDPLTREQRTSYCLPYAQAMTTVAWFSTGDCLPQLRQRSVLSPWSRARQAGAGVLALLPQVQSPLDYSQVPP